MRAAFPAWSRHPPASEHEPASAGTTRSATGAQSAHAPARALSPPRLTDGSVAETLHILASHGRHSRHHGDRPRYPRPGLERVRAHHDRDTAMDRLARAALPAPGVKIIRPQAAAASPIAELPAAGQSGSK